jgi:hypothetical protein
MVRAVPWVQGFRHRCPYAVLLTLSLKVSRPSNTSCHDASQRQCNTTATASAWVGSGCCLPQWSPVPVARSSLHRAPCGHSGPTDTGTGDQAVSGGPLPAQWGFCFLWFCLPPSPHCGCGGATLGGLCMVSGEAACRAWGQFWGPWCGASASLFLLAFPAASMWPVGLRMGRTGMGVEQGIRPGSSCPDHGVTFLACSSFSTKRYEWTLPTSGAWKPHERPGHSSCGFHSRVAAHPHRATVGRAVGQAGVRVQSCPRHSVASVLHFQGLQDNGSPAHQGARCPPASTLQATESGSGPGPALAGVT